MASPFVMQMSAHMSAFDEAMRVVSRKPPPMSLMQDSRSSPERSSSVTSAAAVTCGTWLMTDAQRSCLAMSSVVKFAPVYLSTLMSFSWASGGAPVSSTMTYALPTKRSFIAASTPLFSRPVIGWPAM